MSAWLPTSACAPHFSQRKCGLRTRIFLSSFFCPGMHCMIAPLERTISASQVRHFGIIFFVFTLCVSPGLAIRDRNITTIFGARQALCRLGLAVLGGYCKDAWVRFAEFDQNVVAFVFKDCAPAVNTHRNRTTLTLFVPWAVLYEKLRALSRTDPLHNETQSFGCRKANPDSRGKIGLPKVCVLLRPLTF